MCMCRTVYTVESKLRSRCTGLKDSRMIQRVDTGQTDIRPATQNWE